MDVRILKEVCQSYIPLLEEAESVKPTPKNLLLGMLDKTVELIDSGNTSEDIMFTAQEMVSLTKTGNFNQSQVTKFKADHYNAAVDLLASISELKKAQGNEGNNFQLSLVDTGELGGAGNKKHHYLKLIELAVSDDNGEKVDKKGNEYTVNSIKYEAVRLPRANWYARPFLSIELSSWRLLTFIAAPILILICGFGLFLNVVYGQSSYAIAYWVLFVGFVTVLGLMFIPFYEANMLRIAMAPQWLLKVYQLNAQIESIKSDRIRPNGKPYRRLQLVTYEGKCPKCGNLVEIEKGKRNYKGRLIGICNESPREHRFSFDHITQRGLHL